MVKFLVDESSGKELCNNLIAKGYDAVYVSDVIPGSPDDEVLKFAEREGRTLITNDKDFAELVFRLRKPSSGAILLRLKRDVPKTRTDYLLSLIQGQENKLPGRFTVLTEMGNRVKRIE